MANILKTLVALLAGAIFGFGLALSGMLNPERVRGFLDITGDWDPTLGFVLFGAVSVASLGNVMIKLLSKPVLADAFDVPPSSPIDSPLLTGSAIFGVGWALSGLCPGPAIASLGRDVSTIYVFVLAMVAGVLIHTSQTQKPVTKAPAVN